MDVVVKRKPKKPTAKKGQKSNNDERFRVARWVLGITLLAIGAYLCVTVTSHLFNWKSELTGDGTSGNLGTWCSSLLVGRSFGAFGVLVAVMVVVIVFAIAYLFTANFAIVVVVCVYAVRKLCSTYVAVVVFICICTFRKLCTAYVTVVILICICTFGKLCATFIAIVVVICICTFVSVGSRRALFCGGLFFIGGIFCSRGAFFT